MQNKGIYKIVNPKGNTYIGQSNDIKKRFKTYKNLNCKGQTKLYNSFLKYGVENHQFSVIENGDIDLDEKEKFHKQQFIDKNGWDKCLFLYLNNMYNQK